MFHSLVESIPELVDLDKMRASDYDWALHPGGSLIITGVEKALKLTPEHLRASYEVYMSHGNSSSATVFSVMSKLISGETTDHIIGCAFGPGISVEMMAFKRDQNSSSGSLTPDSTLVAEDVD